MHTYANIKPAEYIEINQNANKDFTCQPCLSDILPFSTLEETNHNLNNSFIEEIDDRNLIKNSLLNIGHKRYSIKN